MRSLINAAKVHEFRGPSAIETEGHYRQALADHVKSRDLIESEEIRNGSGWDKWSEEHMRALLDRNKENIFKPMPDYGELIPIEGFIEEVKFGSYTPDDGSGYYAIEGLMSYKDIDWKELKTGKYDKRWTHIAWFNK